MTSTPASRKASMLRRAIARPPSRSPPWRFSEPQHPCAAGTCTSQPLRVSTRTAASMVEPWKMGMTQPERSPTRARTDPLAGYTCPEARKARPESSGSAASASAIGGTRRRMRLARTRARMPERWYSRSSPPSTRILPGLGSTWAYASHAVKRPSSPRRRGRACACACSMSRPYGTPEGHAASHARHCMHRSQCSTTPGSMPARPSNTAFISAMRPRGDSVSSPVST